MSTKWWLKVVFLAALLVGAAYFFGTVCQQMNLAYQVVIPPSKQALTLLLWLLLALGLTAIAAGIVAALFRPISVALVAVCLSGPALLVGWGISWSHAILTLLYVLAGMAYAFLVQNELRQRVRFSVRILAESQHLLLLALLVVALGSFYLGYAEHITKEGFSIPEKQRNQVAEEVANRVAAGIPEAFREGVRSGIHQQMQYMLSEQFKQAVKPVERYIPAVITVLLFLPLMALVYLLAWVPIGALWLIFLLLRAVGIVNVTAETLVVKRLVIS